jgi:hypothetical protein
MPPAEKKDTNGMDVVGLSSPQETEIIFDWDDTLLASSFLSGKGYRLDSTIEKTPEIDTQLRDLEQSVCTVLNLALSYGNVHIITNAETGWVQLSAQKFIPGVVPLLNKVKVISARSTFEGMFPESPLKWKFYAFQEKLSKSFSEMKTEKNIISFGDSHVEREAVRAVTRGWPKTRTKSVKFAERPSMEQLRRQIELVTNCFQYIHSHDGDLDLQLTVTVNAPTTPNSPSSPSSSNNNNNNNSSINNSSNSSSSSSSPPSAPPTPTHSGSTQQQQQNLTTTTNIPNNNNNNGTNSSSSERSTCSPLSLSMMNNSVPNIAAQNSIKEEVVRS